MEENMETLTDASGNERKGIEVKGVVFSAKKCMFIEAAVWDGFGDCLNESYSTVRDLMLAGN